MIQAIEPLVEIVPKREIPLTVPLVLFYIIRGYNQTQIGEIIGKSQQAISQFMAKHSNHFAPHTGKDNLYRALKSLHLVDRGQEITNNIFDTCNDWDKKDLIPVTAVIDRNIQVAEKLMTTSGQTVSNDTLDASLDDLSKREQEIMAKLKSNTGAIEDIIDV